MSPIRLDRVAVLVGLLLTTTVAASSEAQLVNGRWQLPPAGSGRTGVMPFPQQSAVVYPGTNQVYYQQPMAVSFIPAVFMSDGSVWANFGFGFEPVVRSCGGMVVGGQQRVVAGNGFVVQHASPPTYTQPVPNQAGSQRRQMVVSQAAQMSCFGRDASGRFFARRF